MQKPNVYLFPQLEDNYGYLIKNPHETKGVLVDPSDLDMCLKILELNECSASHIIITHHHDDHIGAVNEIRSKFKSLVIGYKNDSNIPKPDMKVEDKEIFEIHGNEYKVIHTPGHTLQHINYFMLKHNILFSGDTLFSIGCGRMFEGSPEVFWNSLSKLKKLPGDTKVYCGHEYTMANLKFALNIDPNNEKLNEYYKWALHQEKEHRPTIPTTLSDQLLCNPFFRCDSDQFMKFFDTQNATEVFAKMRTAKDNY